MHTMTTYMTYDEFKVFVSGYDKVALETTHGAAFHYAIVDNIDLYALYIHCIEDGATHRFEFDNMPEAFAFYTIQLIADRMGVYAEKCHDGIMAQEVFTASVIDSMKVHIYRQIRANDTNPHAFEGIKIVRELLD
jgi:hypothetical protein